MSAGTSFFLSSCVILTFTILNLNVGPIVNGRVGSDWPSKNCKKISDDLKDSIEKNSDITKREIEKEEKRYRECRNKIAMHNMEYTSFIFNVVIGFICTLLGLFGLQKEMTKKTGIIGMALGVIGFVLTLVYIIYNGVVYTNYSDTNIYKRNEEGAVAELISDFKYECIFFNKENDTDAFYATFSDLIKSQYNYNKDLIDSFDEEKHPEKSRCRVNNPNNPNNPYSYIKGCEKDGVWETQEYYYNGEKCSKIYFDHYSFYSPFTDDSNYDKSARFITVLIFSIFILICHLCLICSGLMLMKEA